MKHLLVGLALLAGPIAGCTRSSPSAPPATEVPAAPARSGDVALPPEEVVDLAQRALRRNVDDDVRVGYVAEVRPGAPQARILWIDTAGLREGERFIFIDQDRRAVAYGRVLEVTSDAVLAAFESRLVRRGRAVREGDLAAFNLAPSARDELEHVRE